MKCDWCGITEEEIDALMTKKKTELTTRTYRMFRYFSISMSLLTLAILLFIVDFIVSLVIDFPGIINLFDWISANPASLPWVLLLLSWLLIILEIFLEDIY